MRVLVVGVGAIGMLVGGELALAGHDVTLVARSALAETLRHQGLHVTGIYGARLTRNFTLVGSVAEAAQSLVINNQSLVFDYLALTVKAYDVPGAVDEIRAAFATPPTIVTFQNGVGSEEAVARGLGDTPIVAVSVTIPVSVPAPGQVEARRKGGMGVAPLGRPPTADYRPQADAVTQALAAAGFVTRPYADYRAMKWSKLLGNMMGNATSAILDMSPGDIYTDPRLFRVEMAALREALAVMRAYDIAAVDLPGVRTGLLGWALRLAPTLALQPILRRMVASGRGGKMPSLHIDLAGGKGKSEVEYLNGAVVAWGAPKGVPTPVNKVLTETLLGLTTGMLARDAFRQRPERLLDALRTAG